MHIGWGIIDSIIKVELVADYEKVESAIDAIKELRHPITDKELEEQLWAKYKIAYFAYYEKYFKRRIEMKSDEAKRYEADMQRKELEFNEYEQIQRYNKYSKN